MRDQDLDFFGIGAQVGEQDGVFSVKALPGQEDLSPPFEAPFGHGIHQDIEVRGVVQVDMGDDEAVKFFRTEFLAGHIDQGSGAGIQKETGSGFLYINPSRGPELSGHHVTGPGGAQKLYPGHT